MASTIKVLRTPCPERLRLPSHEGDEDEDKEEEESNSPPEGGRKKRAASMHLEAEASKKGKVSLADNSAWDIDCSSEWRPRDKPLAES